MEYTVSPSVFLHTLAIIALGTLMIALPGVFQAGAQQPETHQIPTAPVEVFILDKGLNFIGWPSVATTSAFLLDTHPLINEIRWFDSATQQWITDSRALPDDSRPTIEITRGNAIGVVASEVSQLRIPIPGLSASPIYLNQADNGIRIVTAVGNTIEVRLYGNPTTGFDWKVDGGIDGVLTQIGEVRFEGESELLGAGGTFTFRFNATEAGEAMLRLIYHCTFEEGVDPLFTFEATVTVQ